MAWSDGCAVRYCHNAPFEGGLCRRHSKAARDGGDPVRDQEHGIFDTLAAAGEAVGRTSMTVGNWVRTGRVPEGPPWYLPDLVAARDAAADARREQAEGDRGPRSPHGTTSRYSYGCRCDECRSASTVAHADYRRRRRSRVDAPPSSVVRSDEPHSTS